MGAELDIKSKTNSSFVKPLGRRGLLMERYRALRKVQGRLVGSNYDISNRCNLFCEGCLYFAGGEYKDFSDANDAETWNHFFKHEAERGVNFAYIAGAEPSLEPERLKAIARNIHNGNIMTNGIKKIDPSIPYSIHVSIWGDKHNVAKYRGADTTTKAMRNYSGDPRATMVMTINGQNIDQIKNVAAQCAEHGLPLTFSYFSATTDYMNLTRGLDHAEDYIFNSTSDNHLRLSPASFRAARAEIEACKASYPDTIIYEAAYDDWVSQDDPLYDLDEQGIAKNCGNRLTDHFQHISVDLERHSGKCCMPNIDCSDCKAYAIGYASYLALHHNFKDLDMFEKWLDVLNTWLKLYMPLKYSEAFS